jgi:hypothetical protein
VVRATVGPGWAALYWLCDRINLGTPRSHLVSSAHLTLREEQHKDGAASDCSLKTTAPAALIAAPRLDREGLIVGMMMRRLGHQRQNRLYLTRYGFRWTVVEEEDGGVSGTRPER